MQGQKQKIEQFRRLHVPGEPLFLYNIWDPGSAQATTKAGAKAIATSSWAVAEANGFSDGEKTPLTLVIDNLRRIVKATPLPVTIDLESGYGVKPKDVSGTVSLAISAGAVGCNLEDSTPTTRALRDTTEQADRIRGARQAADAASLPFFINARTDIFLGSSDGPHNIAMVGQALKRAEAYKRAGADGLFVPGLKDTALISDLVEASPLPVNVLVRDAKDIEMLANVGVARISVGGMPYVTWAHVLEEAARTATIAWAEHLRRKKGGL